MLKKSILLLTISLLCMGVMHAQDFIDDDLGHNSLKLGLYVMPQSVALSNADDATAGAIYSAMPTYSIAFGMELEYMLPFGLSIGSGLGYSPQGQRFSTDSDLSFGEWKDEGYTRNTYLKVPLNIRYTLFHESPFNIGIYAGPQMSFLFDAGGDVIGYRDGEPYDEVLLTDNKKEFYKNTTFELVGGLGVHYKIHDLVTLEAYFRGDYGLVDAEEKEAVFEKVVGGGTTEYKIWQLEPNRATTHNFRYGISVGASIYIY